MTDTLWTSNQTVVATQLTNAVDVQIFEPERFYRVVLDYPQ